jgi:DNA-binding response OmpR family regulator
MADETILIIDDDPEVLSLLSRSILAPLGYHVLTALDGKTGLEAAVLNSPGLILMDMTMPGFSGLRMLTDLRGKGCRSPVILMTLDGIRTIAVEAFRLGVRDYLPKPFTPAEVRETIDRALLESRLGREREDLNHRLLTAETVRITVITLSHYLNNHLMAISGSLALLREASEQDVPGIDRNEVIQQGREAVRGIRAVMNILLRTTDIRLTPYSNTSPMIDIATALEEELPKVTTGPLPQVARAKPESHS